MKKYLSQGLGLLVLSSLLFGATPVSAATSGPNSVGTGANVSYPGSNYSWSSVSNIQSSNNSRATSTITNSGQNTDYLQATNFGFNIPVGSTIDGIQVYVERSAQCVSSCSSEVRDARIRIIKGGLVQSTDKATGTNWPSSDGVATYGGVADLWGTTWSVSDINASNFGVAISAGRTSGGDKSAQVDHVSITVTYTAPVVSSQTITFSALGNKTYGDANFTVSATASSGLSVSFDSTTPSVCTVSGNTVHIVSVGTCTVQASQAGNGSYSAAANVDQSFTVNKATPTLSVTNSPVVYDGSAKSATVSGSVAGTPSNILTGGVATQTNAGTYAVTADFTPSDTTNYNSLVGASAGNFVIQKADSDTVVTCAEGTYTYTGFAQTPCTVSVTGAGDLNLTPDPVYAHNTDAGTATASYTYAGDDNHNGSNDSTNFAIGKADATIDITDYSDVYDSLSHGLLGSVIGVLAETLSGLDLGDEFTNVPGGSPEWTFTDVTGNYKDASGTGSVVISAKTITVVATGVPKIFDGNTDASVVLGSEDVIEGDDVTFSYTNAYFDDADAGADKHITVEGITLGGADAGNYSLESGTVETTGNISPEAATVNLSGDTSVVYNGNGHELSATTDPEELDVVILYNGLTNAPVNAGTYHVVALITDENYAGQATTTLTVDRKSINVRAEEKSKVYGDEDPELTYVVTTGQGEDEEEGGLVGDDELSGTLTRESGENAGDYDILQGTVDNAHNSNYDINFGEATFTIEKAEQVITFDELSDKTNGDADFDLGATTNDSDEDAEVTYEVTLEEGEIPVCELTGEGMTTVHLLGVGHCTITAYADETDNYLAAEPVTRSFDIANRVYTVHVSTGENGAITPAGEEGSVGVAEGNSQTFTITPDKNYLVENVIVDESSVGAVETYTFTEVSGNHSISATFKRRPSTTSGSIPGGRVLGAFNDNSGDTGSSDNSENTGSTQGQVLGETKFIFTLDMKPGRPYNMKVFGNEVMELQKFLNNAGFGPLVVDGKFGAKTKAALIKFQLKNGLVGDGSVGPLTRAVLNK